MAELYKTHLFQIACGGLVKILEHQGKFETARYTFDFKNWEELSVPRNKKESLQELVAFVEQKIDGKSTSRKFGDYRLARLDSYNDYFLHGGTNCLTGERFVSVRPLDAKWYKKQFCFKLRDFKEKQKEKGFSFNSQVVLLRLLQRQE